MTDELLDVLSIKNTLADITNEIHNNARGASVF